MPRRVVVTVLALLSGLALVGCGSDDNGGAIVVPTSDTGGDGGAVVKKVDITAAGFAFDPTAIALTAGEDVQFVIANSDGVLHNLTVEGLGVDQDVEGENTATSDTASDLKAGTYEYRCKYHPQQMEGTVTVS